MKTLSRNLAVFSLVLSIFCVNSIADKSKKGGGAWDLEGSLKGETQLLEFIKDSIRNNTEGTKDTKLECDVQMLSKVIAEKMELSRIQKKPPTQAQMPTASPENDPLSDPKQRECLARALKSLQADVDYLNTYFLPEKTKQQ